MVSTMHLRASLYENSRYGKALYLLHASILDLDQGWRRSFESRPIVFDYIWVDDIFQVDRVVRIALGNLMLGKLVPNEC
jgi:hypothetical protein